MPRKRPPNVQTVLDNVDRVLADPEKHRYLQREVQLRLAERAFESMQRVERLLGRELTPIDASWRFMGKKMWFHLMMWAGFPLWVTDEDLPGFDTGGFNR